MLNRPAWFDACLIAAVFATILLPGSAHISFFTFVLNLACIGMFVYPMVDAVRSGELAEESDELLAV